jgi:hypothetical protein
LDAKIKELLEMARRDMIGCGHTHVTLAFSRRLSVGTLCSGRAVRKGIPKYFRDSRWTYQMKNFATFAWLGMDRENVRRKLLRMRQFLATSEMSDVILLRRSLSSVDGVGAGVVVGHLAAGLNVHQDATAEPGDRPSRKCVLEDLGRLGPTI